MSLPPSEVALISEDRHPQVSAGDCGRRTWAVAVASMIGRMSSHCWRWCFVTGGGSAYQPWHCRLNISTGCWKPVKRRTKNAQRHR
jgi:hypothetical protein